MTRVVPGARLAMSASACVGALAALAFWPPAWHAAVGCALYLLLRMLAPEVRAALGPARRWLVWFVVLFAIGALVGPRDCVLGGVALSKGGGFAAATMVTRGLCVLGLSASLLASPLATRALANLRGTRSGAFGRALHAALALAPSFFSTLEERRARIRNGNPGLLRAPRRIFENLVCAVEHAADLADGVADEFRDSQGHGRS